MWYVYFYHTLSICFDSILLYLIYACNLNIKINKSHYQSTFSSINFCICFDLQNHNYSILSIYYFIYIYISVISKILLLYREHGFTFLITTRSPIFIHSQLSSSNGCCVETKIFGRNCRVGTGLSNFSFNFSTDRVVINI